MFLFLTLCCVLYINKIKQVHAVLNQKFFVQTPHFKYQNIVFKFLSYGFQNQCWLETEDLNTVRADISAIKYNYVNIRTSLIHSADINAQIDCH